MPRFVLPMLLCALLVCGAAGVVLHAGSPRPKVVVTGPPRPPPPIQTYIAMTRVFEGMDVRVEVDNALRRGDRRLVGIGSCAGVIPPGVEDFMPRWEYYAREYGIRCVPCTFDMNGTDELYQLRRAADRFATQYNRLLLARAAAGDRPPATAPTTAPCR